MTTQSVLGEANFEDGSEPYAYTPLSKRQIRVLELSPAGQETDQLRGRLLVKGLEELPPRRKPFSSDVAEPIDPTKHVYFEAISYVWGEPSFTESLVTPDGFIRITTSLASILRRIRHHEDSRLYWADGLCINQEDISEKEIQVPVMGVIYGSAVRVLCDLCDEDIDLLLDAMERYWKKNIRRGFQLSQSRSTVLSKETSAAVMGVRLPTQEEADEIKGFEMEDWSEQFLEFLSFPWFHRLWIFQEFILARDVSMIFGRRHMPWGEIWAITVSYLGAEFPWDSVELATPENTSKLVSLNFMCCIRACRIIDPNAAHGREFMEAIRVSMGGADISQAQLHMSLVAGCFKQCRIPRDRYFAILGLVDEAGDGKGGELQVDYISPIRDITIYFWKHALQLSSGGELILIAGIAGQSEGYPSWLRDITVPSPLDYVWLLGPLANDRHKTGGDLGTWSAAFSQDDPDQMITEGLFFVTIAELSNMEPKELFEMEAMILWFEKAITFFTSDYVTTGSGTDTPYPLTGERIQDAAIKTVCDFGSEDELNDDSTAIHQLGQSLLAIAASYPNKDEDMIEAISASIEDKMDVFTQLFTRVFSTRGLRLCKTDKGMFAMSPQEALAGDFVWVLKGCRLPIILRPSPAYVGSFEIVGFGYVCGIMNGEVLKRPGFHWGEISLR
ncbi:hypothetical protein FVEN_g1032 [Fusarium venenatum]|uniref:Heterokaryon incompatibility domain-containing protein n=1 Tax=Fusarium venenatum TaxID=56646 RepID=A0A2L2THL0_9HYPO|nr:uncharacterized protein FVRRES_10539 [Fusarium venenatum]KAG8361351.1 hypothetical protein FVEN_g1032 [Fusarium venenatum]KAH6967140.1 heterokaryon incompatibility protein-domain-containing protein [Fusarium venenatum]CEI70462.1 unnamed protein product [Fusarium venenatum]